MSRLDHLPPDQKAALSLVLRRRDSYADLAAVLKISERAVHDRAHAALAMLAPTEARALTAEQRDEIGEYLLGQQRDEVGRAATVRLLEGSAEALAWARALAAALEPIADGALAQALEPLAHGALADIPGEAATAPAARAPDESTAAPATAPPKAASRAPSQPSGAGASASRRAGAILLVVLVAVAVGAVFGIKSLSGGSSHRSTAGAAGKQVQQGATGAASAATGAPQAVRVTLRPATAGSRALGVAMILSESTTFLFEVVAEKLPPSNGFVYAVWLYNSPASAEPVGKSPAVHSDGRLRADGLLPANAAGYKHLIVTRETSNNPSHPGPVVLSGEITLH
jgi:hypothetical protein